MAVVVVAATASGWGSLCGDRASKDPAEVRALAQRVYVSFTGTVEQQNAGHVLAAYATNGPMDACLERRGHPEWDWSLARTYAAPDDALGSTDWFAELRRPVYSENEIAMQDYLAAEREMNADGRRSEEYEKAIDACLHPTEQTSDDDVDRASAPHDTKALTEAWDSTMRRAGERLAGDWGRYEDCLEAADLDVLSAADAPPDELGVLMAREAGGAGPPPAGSEEPNEKWRRFLALEKKVVEVDADCRQDAYDVHIAEMAPVIEDFADQHADAIARAQREWREIAARTAALGYHGQRGPLGE